MALMIYRAEKLLFKHALNLSLHYFKKHARVFSDFECTEEEGFGFFVLQDQYYKHGDIKIAFYLERMNEVKVWLEDTLVLSFIFTIPDEGYDLSEWLSIIADKIVGFHLSLRKKL